MAENIINIATLTIDSEKAVKTIEQTKTEIFGLQKANTELRKEITKNGDATGELTKQFVANELELKKLNATYREQQTALNSLTLEEVKNSEAVTQNSRSVGEAVAQNKELIKIRNQVDATTEDGRKAIELLNAKIDENNAFVNANTSAIEQQKNNVGNYTNAIAEAAGALNPLNGGLSGFVERANEAGGAGNLAKQSLGGMATGFIQMTKAALGFILTPVGAVITGLVVVFVAIKEAMARSEDATNRVTKVFASLKGIANVLLKAVSSVGEYFIDTYIGIFEKVADVTEKGVGLISKGLKTLGFNDAAKSVDTFVKSTKASIDAATKLATAEQQLEKQQRQSRLIQLQYQKDAEKFRQIRDDENRTIAERIKANDDLGKTLKKQIKDELAIAQLALQVANARIAAEGKTKANLDAQAEALTEIADIQERITGQESEQLTNRVALQKEAADKAKEARDKANEQFVKNAELEISISKQKNAALNQKDEERAQFIKNIADQEIKLLQDKKKRGLISEKEFALGVKEIRAAQSDELLTLAENAITKEIEAQKKLIEEKKNLSSEELTNLISNAALLRDAQVAEIEKSLLLESDKAKAKLEIEKAYNESVTTLNNNYREAEKVRAENALREQETLRVTAQEIRLLALTEQGVSEAEIQRLSLELQHENTLTALDADLQAQKKTAEEVRALKEVEDKKYSVAVKKMDKELAASKRAMQLGMVKDSISALNAIFGENKAVAVASALVNTYEGISAGVKLGYPAAIPAVAAAAATGFAAVKNILKTNKDSTSGEGGTQSGTTGGRAIFENPARTNATATVNAAPPVNQTPVSQPVLVVETLQEVIKQQAIKINSKG